MDTFTRTHLLQQAGSSIAGLRNALEKVASRFSHPELPSLIQMVGQIEDWSKPAELIRLLRQATGKVLIFVSHLAAQGTLADCLIREGIPFVLFHGSLTPSEKATAFASFRNDISVMLATDSAGEGRNLQFATTVVNYDLPWNPMRIEQRIGRVHRIGQDKEVFVFNFCLRDSVEEYVLRVLHDKINMFELVVGEIDSILGDMDSDADFSETVREMWLDNQERIALEKSFDDLAARMVTAKEDLRATQMLDEKIFGEDLNA
jgi:SNF2 family DNA or RNA helicase